MDPFIFLLRMGRDAVALITLMVLNENKQQQHHQRASSFHALLETLYIYLLFVQRAYINAMQKTELKGTTYLSEVTFYTSTPASWVHRNESGKKTNEWKFGLFEYSNSEV